jgi:hypothetical protein
MLTHEAVRVTMLVATAGWAAGEVLMQRDTAGRAARFVWTAALALALLHAALALHVVYGWNHEAAIAGTARQAGALTGVAWRGALAVNYVFLLLWLTDAAWWWIAPASRAARPAGLETARFAIFLFMFLNGAVIFASPSGRLVGLTSLAVVLASRVGARRRRWA